MHTSDFPSHQGGETAIINMVKYKYNINPVSIFIIVRLETVPEAEINNGLRESHDI